MCKERGETLRLKVISDGTAFGTRVETEDGELLYPVVKVTCRHRAGKPPHASICVLDVDLEVEAEDPVVNSLAAGTVDGTAAEPGPGPGTRVEIDPGTESPPLFLEVLRLQEELDVTDKLLKERMRVIDAIPPCPAHGSQCVPHALTWIERHRWLDEAQKALREFNE